MNNFGPQLFKNFDKLRLIAKEGSSRPGSRAGSKNASPFKNRSRAASKGDLMEIDLDYMDQLELTRAFSCLQELENI